MMLSTLMHTIPCHYLVSGPRVGAAGPGSGEDAGDMLCIGIDVHDENLLDLLYVCALLYLLLFLASS